MRVIAMLNLALLGFCTTNNPEQAEKARSAKCREQLQACTKNYAGKTCRTEYDIYMNVIYVLHSMPRNARYSSDSGTTAVIALEFGFTRADIQA